MKKGLVLLFFILFSVVSVAASTTMSLTLNSIEVIKTSEKSGDEIYLDILVYPKSGKAIHKRIPNYPLSWPSRALNKLKDVSLLKSELEEGESASIMISVVDRDAPPWNTDDLIGLLKLYVKNEGGKLDYKFKATDTNSKIESQNGDSIFYLTGDGSSYKLSLKLK